MFAINAQTREESMFVHLASTLEKGVEWIKKHGHGWYEEEYCFFSHEVTIDKDDYIDEGYDNACYIDLAGNMSELNPLFEG